MPERALEWRVEETCLNAWPALREVLLDGWVLRFSAGLTRRANSANPLRPIERLHLRECEALYGRLGLPAIFRVLSLIDTSLDQRLAAAGYSCEGESCVLYGTIDDIDAARDPDIRLLTSATPEWFAAMARLQNHTKEQAETYRRIVGQLAVPAAFAVLCTDAEILALAYGTIHRGLLCYESVIADSRQRRQGFGRRIVTALAVWGKDNGAEGACLEVEAGNLPALALYRALGLKTELYRYHSRRQPQALP